MAENAKPLPPLPRAESLTVEFKSDRERLRQTVRQYGNSDRVLLELNDEELDGSLGFTTRNEAGERVPTLSGLRQCAAPGNGAELRAATWTHPA